MDLSIRERGSAGISMVQYAHEKLGTLKIASFQWVIDNFVASLKKVCQCSVSFFGPGELKHFLVMF